MANLTKTEKNFDFLHSPGRPFHIHTCEGADGEEPHTWKCDSPYCEVLQENCTAHGGIPPIRIGREPWRGH